MFSRCDRSGCFIREVSLLSKVLAYCVPLINSLPFLINRVDYAFSMLASYLNAHFR